MYLVLSCALQGKGYAKDLHFLSQCLPLCTTKNHGKNPAQRALGPAVTHVPWDTAQHLHSLKPFMKGILDQGIVAALTSKVKNLTLVAFYIRWRQSKEKCK